MIGISTLLGLVCGSKVHELDGFRDYEAFLESATDEEQWVLLDFFAPWCGHCKRLNPVLDEFAAVRPSARVGKVDATKHKALAKQHGVSGYPSLRFRGPSETKFRDYKGARDAAALQQLDDRLRSPPLSEIDGSQESLIKLKDMDPGVTFVMSSENVADRQLFEEVAQDRRHEANFALVGASTPGAVVPNQGIYLVDGNLTLYRYDGEANFRALKAWVKKHNVQLWNRPLGPGTFRKISDARLVVACVVDPENLTDFPASVEQALISRPTFRERFAGGELDGVRWADYVSTFGVDSNNLPRLVVIDLRGDKFWNMPPHQTDVAQFLADIAEAKLKPRYMGIRGFPDRALHYYKSHPIQVNAAILAIIALLAATIYFATPRADREHTKAD